MFHKLYLHPVSLRGVAVTGKGHETQIYTQIYDCATGKLITGITKTMTRRVGSNSTLRDLWAVMKNLMLTEQMILKFVRRCDHGQDN